MLQPTVREPLWPFLEDHRTEKYELRSHQEIVTTLMRSHETIELHLAELRQRIHPRQEQSG